MALEVDDVQGVSSCFIMQGSFSASLEALLAEGCLTCDDAVLDVEQDVIDDIERWALANGY